MRLTKKVFDNLYASPCDEDTEEKQAEQQWKVCNKLGLLEDVEDKLGIDLTILAKAFLYGIYFKFEFGKTHICKGHPYNFNSKKFTVVDEEEEGFSPQYIMSYTDCEYKDYGKTWALTKEELENHGSKEER